MSFFIGGLGSGVSEETLVEIQKAVTDANTAAQNAQQKITDLDNYDFEIVKMGSYKIDNNETDDTLDFTYEG